ncbi:MAG: hypothetical protein ACR2OH_08635 [Microthrixaceae bacterium]
MKQPTTRVIAGAVICAGVLLPAGAASAASQHAPAATTPTVTDSIAEPPKPNAFRFGCRVVRGDDRHEVRCRWKPIESRRIAGYVVYRAQLSPEQLPREAIERVRSGDRPGIVDDQVRPGTAWVYAAVAVGHHGEPLAVSTLDRVAIPPAS